MSKLEATLNEMIDKLSDSGRYFSSITACPYVLVHFHFTLAVQKVDLTSFLLFCVFFLFFTEIKKLLKYTGKLLSLFLHFN